MLEIEKLNMKRIRKILLVLFILFSVAGCDRTTKMLAMDKLSNSQPLSFLWNTIVLQYVENTGAFLSFGSHFAESVRFLLFVVLPIFILGGLFIFICVSNKISRSQVIGYSLILGGGVGNMYDRVFQFGHVIDFMNVGIGPIRTGIFNVADVAVLAGFIILVVPLILKQYLRRSRSNL